MCVAFVLNPDAHLFILTSQGQLKGFDQKMNILLDSCVERVFSLTGPPEVAELGLYIIRGDSVAILGKVDEKLEEDVDTGSLRGLPIPPAHV